MENQTMHKYPALLYSDFRLVWIGQFISIVGTEMQIVGLNWHIYLLTHSAVMLGLLGLARFLPIVVFSLIGGLIADAHNRKLVLLTSYSLSAVFATILAVTTITHIVTPLIVFAMTILTAIAFSFSMPANTALVPSLVKKEHVPNAISLGVTAYFVGSVVGPALSGFFIAQFGIGSVYLANAISFIVLVAALLLIKHSGETLGEKADVSLSSIKEGIRFITGRTIVWSTMILDFFATFFASAPSLMPIFAKDILSVGPVGLGFLYAAPSIGAAVAGFGLTHMGKIKRQGLVLLISVIVYGVATIFFGISKIYFLSLLFLAISGAGDSVSAIIRNMLRQLETPDNFRGRMTSINMIFFMGGPQLGEFEAGLVAAVVGAPASVVIGGVGTIVAVGILAATIPVLRNYHGHNAEG